MTGASSQLAVQATGLGRRFGRSWALAHVDLAVPYATSLWLRGSNGAGKTTLLRMLASLSVPSRGKLEVAGYDVYRQSHSIRSRVSLVSHALYLYPGLTPRETLRLWHRLGPKSDELNTDDLLDAVGLSFAADRRIGGFSAGMRKRLALARTRLEAPKVLLLDEPFSSLDTAGCDLVEDWVRDFVDSGGTVVMASHDHERSSALCEGVVDLRDGQVVSTGIQPTGVGSG